MIENEKKEELGVHGDEESQIQSDTKVISFGEYEEYIRLKEQINNVKPKEINRDLSILRFAFASVSILFIRSASSNNCFSTRSLSSASASSFVIRSFIHFNKEVLLAKGYTLKDIMQAQRRELVRKFVPIEQIKAISKLSDITHIDGEILEQLVSLAKVNIKLRKNANSNSSSVDSITGNIVTKSE